MKYSTYIFFCFLLLSQTSFAQCKPNPNALGLMIGENIKGNNNGYRWNFKYVYMNNNPYGRNASVVYDDFFHTYKISFTKKDGSTTSCEVEINDFSGVWEFCYNNKKYYLSNNK